MCCFRRYNNCGCQRRCCRCYTTCYDDANASVPAVEILHLTPAAPLETPAIETVTTTAMPPAAMLAIRTAMKPELQTALCL